MPKTFFLDQTSSGHTAQHFEITTMIGCPLMCNFCPQDKLRKAYKDPVRIMTMDSFSTALHKLPKHFTITFAGYSEPWANKQCTDFLEYALVQGRDVAIFTTLSGMTQKDVSRIVTLHQLYTNKFKKFVVHLPDNRGNMRGWSPNDDYSLAVQAISKQISDCQFITMDQENQTHESLQIQSTVGWWPITRAGNLDIVKLNNQHVNPAPRHDFVVECLRDKNFTSNVMLPNGDLALCCHDYGLKHIIGNILQQTWEEIVSGSELTKIKKLNNTLSYTDEVLCKSCNDGYCRTPWNDQEIYQRTVLEAPHWLGP